MNERQAALASLSHQVVASAASHGTAGAVAHALVEALRRASAARQVTLVVADSDARTRRLVVVSGQSRPDQRREVVRAVLACVNEARARIGRVEDAGAGVSVVCPSDDPDPPVGGTASAHAGFSADRELALATHVWAYPTGGYLAVVLERDLPSGFARSEIERYARATSDAAALVHRLHRERQGLRQRLGTLLRELRLSMALPAPVAAALAVWHRRVPRAASVCVLLLVFLVAGLLVPAPQVVRARVTIETSNRQIVTVAEPGQLRSAHVKPGDHIEAGDVLATLDQQDAVLVLASWQSEAHRNQEERSRAIATRDRQALGSLMADSERIATELKRAERQLAYRTIEAPFSGVVLSGDPGARLGAAVETGEVLFELGTLDDLRMMIEVDERDIRLVHAGQLARVKLAGLPSRRWEVELDEPLPVAVAEPGKIVFRVPASIGSDADGLKPGMQGVSRIVVGKQPLLLNWTRGVREQLGLLAWRIGLVS